MTVSGFLPWIGDEYWEQPYKILVLGESHHSNGKKEACAPDENEAKATINLTRDFLAGHNRHAFGSKVGNLVGRYMGWLDDAGYPNARDAFRKIAFYNFLTSSVSSHRDLPTNEAVVASRPAFIDILDKLKPDLVIALGANKQTWFLRDIVELEYIQSSTKPFVARRGTTTIVVCNHPQGRFSYGEAIRLLNEGKLIAEAYS